MSASASGRRGGVPSTTQPIAGPWLSPQVVNRNTLPKLLPATRPPLNDGDVRRVHCLHADHVIAAIDVMHLAGDAGAKIAQQIEPRAAHFVDGDVALQRRIVAIPFEDIGKVADAGGGEGADGARRNRVDAYVLAAQIDGEITHARFERRLG